MGVIVPSTLAEAEKLLRGDPVVANFCATWAEPCVHLNTVFSELASEHAILSFVQVRHTPSLPDC